MSGMKQADFSDTVRAGFRRAFLRLPIDKRGRAMYDKNRAYLMQSEEEKARIRRGKTP